MTGKYQKVQVKFQLAYDTMDLHHAEITLHMMEVQYRRRYNFFYF